MKTVALISGGKDSCYNMVQCVAEGHDIVALANLKPIGKDELDSYMYQTVGHHAIDLYAEAMDLPLYRREIRGSSQSVGKDYTCVKDDEVEDLYELLKTVKEEKDIQGVAVGAILSNYQRVRVENVCSRLGLTPLAYLWRRDQSELLEEMIQCKIEAIIIKVAAMGLTPKKHLGKTLVEMQDYLEKKSKEYDLNVCGEGGEFETFTLDCPLFRKKIVLDETETVLHSDDPIAPVGYYNLRKAHLEDKHVDPSLSQSDLVKDLPMKRSSTLLQELFMDEEPSNCVDCDKLRTQNCSYSTKENIRPKVNCQGDRVWITGLVGKVEDGVDIGQLTTDTMERLVHILQGCGPGWDMSCLVLVHLYVRNMADFAAVNSVYKTYFGINPAARVCVQASLPEDVAMQLDCYGYCNHENRDTMHVQGLSHWAPANIGPYSQCAKIGNCLYVAGQIGMVPANLSIISGGICPEARLSLRHVDRVLSAMCHGCTINHVITCVCYVIQTQFIPVAKEEWNKARTKDASPCECIYVVVPMLPKGAVVEWQVTALQSAEISCKDYHYVRSETGLQVTIKCVCCLKEAEAEEEETSTQAQFCSLTGCISKTQAECGSSLPSPEQLAELLYKSHIAVLNKAGLKLEHQSAPRFFYPASALDYRDFNKELEERYGSLPFTIVPVLELDEDVLVSMSVIP